MSLSGTRSQCQRLSNQQNFSRRWELGMYYIRPAYRFSLSADGERQTPSFYIQCAICLPWVVRTYITLNFVTLYLGACSTQCELKSMRCLRQRGDSGYACVPRHQKAGAQALSTHQAPGLRLESKWV